MRGWGKIQLVALLVLLISLAISSIAANAEQLSCSGAFTGKFIEDTWLRRYRALNPFDHTSFSIDSASGVFEFYKVLKAQEYRYSDDYFLRDRGKERIGHEHSLALAVRFGANFDFDSKTDFNQFYVNSIRALYIDVAQILFKFVLPAAIQMDINKKILLRLAGYFSLTEKTLAPSRLDSVFAEILSMHDSDWTTLIARLRSISVDESICCVSPNGCWDCPYNRGFEKKRP